MFGFNTVISSHVSVQKLLLEVGERFSGSQAQKAEQLGIEEKHGRPRGRRCTGPLSCSCDSSSAAQTSNFLNINIYWQD